MRNVDFSVKKKRGGGLRFFPEFACESALKFISFLGNGQFSILLFIHPKLQKDLVNKNKSTGHSMNYLGTILFRY